MRPRRSVELTPAGYTVSGTSFFTANEELAHRVRDELDKTDRLSCPHAGVPLTLYLCGDCGEQVDP